jgi:hypothetical protein
MGELSGKVAVVTGALARGARCGAGAHASAPVTRPLVERLCLIYTCQTEFCDQQRRISSINPRPHLQDAGVDTVFQQLRECNHAINAGPDNPKRLDER